MDENNFKASRYFRWHWFDAAEVPPIGTSDYVPKTGRLIRLFDSGGFTPHNQYTFPQTKENLKLNSLKECVYCDETSQKLTNEHIIPEFLNAGLQLPEASCSNCQQSTCTFESKIADQMFGAVRKNLDFRGKKGPLKKSKYKYDSGTNKTNETSIDIQDHPTILAMPSFFPASSYSNRPISDSPVFNYQVYNLNVTPEKHPGHINAPTTDTFSFAQMIAKIAHVSVIAFLERKPKKMYLTELIKINYNDENVTLNPFEHVGRIWEDSKKETDNLHEIEVGKIEWNGKTMWAAKVRLFACYNMPTYHVTVGHD